MTNGINGYRTVWLVAVYDCPMTTREARSNYTKFRELLLKENFVQLQYSLYLRHFPTLAASNAVVYRLKDHVPPGAKLVFFNITDKQYGMTKSFYGPKEDGNIPRKPRQVELFWASQKEKPQTIQLVAVFLLYLRF